jgi:hypothetical protein
MNDIWNSLVKDSSATIDKHFDAIMDDLLASILGKEWRVRQACCAAIGDLIQGRSIDKVRIATVVHLDQILIFNSTRNTSLRYGTSVSRSSTTLRRLSVLPLHPLPEFSLLFSLAVLRLEMHLSSPRLLSLRASFLSSFPLQALNPQPRKYASSLYRLYYKLSKRQTLRH